jgi:hypothetical protein
MAELGTKISQMPDHTGSLEGTVFPLVNADGENRKFDGGKIVTTDDGGKIALEVIPDGVVGTPGPPGPAGPTGATGPQGPPGSGSSDIPSGTALQYLKRNAANSANIWDYIKRDLVMTVTDPSATVNVGINTVIISYNTGTCNITMEDVASAQSRDVTFINLSTTQPVHLIGAIFSGHPTDVPPLTAYRYFSVGTVYYLDATSSLGGSGAGDVTLNGVQTLTNKTLSTGTKFNFGTNAAGDMFYLDGTGNLVRVPADADGKVWKLNSGVPGWYDDLQGSGSGGDAENAIKVVLTAGTTSTIMSGNVTALQNALNSAADNQLVVVPNGTFSLNGTITMSSTTKQFNVRIHADLNFTAGNGFILDGNYHLFHMTGMLYGGQTGATNEASYSAYVGDGLYLRNCDKCVAIVNRIEGFQNGIKYGGESTVGPKGTQYTRVYYNQIRNNYRQIWITTTGTTTSPVSQGNWATSGQFFGGQLGRGLDESGGTYGIVMQKGASSNQGGTTGNNPFNYHHFWHTGFEGLKYGVYWENAEYNKMIGGRLETGAIDGYVMFLREDDTNGLACKDNDLSQFPIAYEDVMVSSTGVRFFAVGGRGLQTLMPPMLDVSGFKISEMTGRNGSGGYVNFGFDEAGSSVNDTWYTGGFTDTKNQRYAAHVTRKVANGNVTTAVDQYVAFEGKIASPTGNYTVLNQDAFIFSTAAANSLITLPGASSWPDRPLCVVNLGTATVTVNGVALPPTASISLKSNGSIWVDISKKIVTATPELGTTITDADYTFAAGVNTAIFLSLTANRTANLPSASALAGREIEIVNASSAFQVLLNPVVKIDNTTNAASVSTGGQSIRAKSIGGNWWRVP